MQVISSSTFIEVIDGVEYRYSNVLTEDCRYDLLYTAVDDRKLLMELVNANIIDNDVLDMFKSELKQYDSPAQLSHTLPGVDKVIKHPVSGLTATLHTIIMNLNDMMQPDKGRPWTREEIADWIEEVMPLEDIMFKSPGVNNEAGKLSEFANLVKTERVLPR